MNTKVQKRLVAGVMKCSPKRVKFDSEQISEIKESITKRDLRSLISEGTIKIKQKKGVSRVRANKIAKQKSAGKRRGAGSRKGKAGARTPQKDQWMIRIRKQRELLKQLKDKKILSTQVYRDLYQKAKGGYFRSIRHIKLYINEKGLANDNKK